jgi:hypothetical protein
MQSKVHVDNCIRAYTTHTHTHTHTHAWYLHKQLGLRGHLIEAVISALIQSKVHVHHCIHSRTYSFTYIIVFRPLIVSEIELVTERGGQLPTSGASKRTARAPEQRRRSLQSSSHSVSDGCQHVCGVADLFSSAHRHRSTR